MRILLDERVNARLRAAFPSHAVRTATEAGWRSATDNSILELAEAHFDVLVTVDRKLKNLHHRSSRRLALVIVRVANNTLEAYRPMFAEILRAVEQVAPGTVLRVPAVKL
ncbi:MAG: DUF5615 family PIN-like protein [Bryobacterales bacterium]|nr:DUF5615 family PIN-like protein [Bryobacterales bacterium]